MLDELKIGGNDERTDEDSEYLQILRELINQKSRSVKANNAYERNGKLIKFALGRGFSMDAIMKVIKETGDDEFPEI